MTILKICRLDNYLTETSVIQAAILLGIVYIVHFQSTLHGLVYIINAVFLFKCFVIWNYVSLVLLFVKFHIRFHFELLNMTHSDEIYDEFYLNFSENFIIKFS